MNIENKSFNVKTIESKLLTIDYQDK